MSQDEIKICQVQTRITPTMICPVDTDLIFSQSQHEYPPDFNNATSPSPIIMIIVHQAVDSHFKLMVHVV